MSGQAAQLTPEALKREKRRKRWQRVRFWLSLHLYHGAVYRAQMKLWHRMGWCWLQPHIPLTSESKTHDYFHCDWCGMHAERIRNTRGPL